MSARSRRHYLLDVERRAAAAGFDQLKPSSAPFYDADELGEIGPAEARALAHSPHDTVFLLREVRRLEARVAQLERHQVDRRRRGAR
jgi:hypothetical protein